MRIHFTFDRLCFVIAFRFVINTIQLLLLLFIVFCIRIFYALFSLSPLDDTRNCGFWCVCVCVIRSCFVYFFAFYLFNLLNDKKPFFDIHRKQFPDFCRFDLISSCNMAIWIMFFTLNVIEIKLKPYMKCNMYIFMIIGRLFIWIQPYLFIPIYANCYIVFSRATAIISQVEWFSCCLLRCFHSVLVQLHFQRKVK